jgi:uncharacterized membrane protein YphA (DoxX/SURF4 family)
MAPLRFVYAYVILFCVPVSIVPRGAVDWVGRHVLGIQGEIVHRFNGSGDRTADWIRALCLLALAVLGALVWTLVDRRRTDYSRLHRWVRLLVRWSLGTALISYGSFKVIQSQFPEPQLTKLVQPIGDSSPMGLLWTFMGSSGPYNAFTGGGEMLGGILVFFPRTVLLGALVAIGVMSHVVALNFSYDVPVKLYSVHLLLLAVFLAAPDFRRLANLFVLNRTAEAIDEPPMFARLWLNRAATALRWIVVVGTVAASLTNSYRGRQQILGMAAPAPIRGVWNVEEFERDGAVLAPLTTDAFRWSRLVVAGKQTIATYSMAGTPRFHRASLDTAAKTIKLGDAALSYKQDTPDDLAMEGQFEGARIRVKLKRVPESGFLLLNRGFHWVNETPYNR